MTSAYLKIRVMSFNIASGMTIDERLDLDLTASVIEKAEVDIAGIQEVEQNFSERSDFTDQVKWLADRLNMYVAFGPNLVTNPTDAEWPEQAYGNAILSRYPIKNHRNHLLEKLEPENEQRGLLEAAIEVNGETISFFTTHLSLKKKQLEQNIKEVLDIVNQKETPIILTGDFNAEPHSPTIERVEEEFMNVFGSKGPYPKTYKEERDHGQKIDYIFCSPHFRVLTAEAIETEASDHEPVLALLQLDSEA